MFFLVKSPFWVSSFQVNQPFQLDPSPSAQNKTNPLPLRVLPKIFKQIRRLKVFSLQPCQASHYSVDPRCILGQSLPIPSSTPFFGFGHTAFSTNCYPGWACISGKCSSTTKDCSQIKSGRVPSWSSITSQLPNKTTTRKGKSSETSKKTIQLWSYE